MVPKQDIEKFCPPGIVKATGAGYRSEGKSLFLDHDCFAGVFAIEDGDLTPKPNPATFRRMLERFDIAPHRAAFFEDTPKNLEPAKALGMTTILIGDGHGKPLGDHIDIVAPDLLDFLSDLNLKDAA